MPKYFTRASFFLKNLMVTTRFLENTNQSIMLTIGFQEKWYGTFFYNIFFGHTNKCPLLKKIILSFKTPFLHFSLNWTSLAIARITLG